MTMAAGKVVKRWLLRMTGFALRVCRRLRLFPFMLTYVLLSAGLKIVELWRGHKLARVGETDGATLVSPVGVMLWLDEIGRDVSALDEGGRIRQFDACLKLSADVADANLHDVVSVLLTSPRLRSIGLYWDEEALADDLPWWQGAEARRTGTSASARRDDLRRPGVEACRAFFEATHQGIVLPVAANRDAQTLVKRLARAAPAVCLNVPEEVRWLVDENAAALPDVEFFDVDPILPGSPSAARNVLSLYGYGLNLHERMAIARATDAYVGRFDEAGCAALAAGRPTVLVGGGTAACTEPLSRTDTALWLPDPSSPDIGTTVLAFLRRHTVVVGAEATVCR